MNYTPLITNNLVGVFYAGDAQSSSGVTPDENGEIVKIPNRLTPGTSDMIARTGGGFTLPLYKVDALDGNRPLGRLSGAQQCFDTGIVLESDEPYTILYVGINRIIGIPGGSGSLFFSQNNAACQLLTGADGSAYIIGVFGYPPPRDYPSISALPLYSHSADVPLLTTIGVTSDGAGVQGLTVNGNDYRFAETTDANVSTFSWDGLSIGVNTSNPQNCMDFFAMVIYKGRKLTQAQIKAETVNIAKNLRDSKNMTVLGNSFVVGYTLPDATDIRPPVMKTGSERFSATTGQAQRTVDAFLTAYPSGYADIQAVVGFPIFGMIDGNGSAPWKLCLDPMHTKHLLFFIGEPTNALFGFGRTNAQCLADMKAFTLSLLNYGVDLIYTTGLWSRGSNQETSTAITDFNTPYKSWCAVQSKIEYLAANEDPRWPDATDLTWWNSDQTHQNAAQQEALATDWYIPRMLEFFDPTPVAPAAGGGPISDADITRILDALYIRAQTEPLPVRMRIIVG